MSRVRVIPSLLLQNTGLVKTVKFKSPNYIGDPINTVKLFNDKEVDEIMILDISASVSGEEPNFELISRIAGEAFMPLSIGGGISTINQVRELFSQGAEKVVLNSSAIKNPVLISNIAEKFGSQSIVVSIDIKKNIFGNYHVYSDAGKKNTKLNPVEFAKEAENRGAGEVLLTSIDKEGTFEGFDIAITRKIADAIDIPVIANGGAKDMNDFSNAIKLGHASAVAAGSMFVYQGPHKAVLISYPEQHKIGNLTKHI